MASLSLIISNCSPKLQSIKLEDTITTPSKDDQQFQVFWLALIDSLKNSQDQYLKVISLDSVWAGDSLYSSNVFFQKCYSKTFNERRITLLSDTTKIRYTWTEANPSGMTTDAKKRIIKVGKIYRFRQVEISKIKKGVVHPSIDVDFIETTQGYKFYGVSYLKRRKCCH